MAVLTTKQRKALPPSSFALPGRRAYPVEDKVHAKNALSRVSRFGSAAEKSAVRAAVGSRFPGLAQAAERRAQFRRRK